MAEMMSKEKAKKMMKEGMVKGKPMSEKQKGYFGMMAGGKKTNPLKRRFKKGY